MPETAEPVRNVWGNNMAIRRQVFDMAGGFRDDIGKVGKRSRPEDTDLCLRTIERNEGGTWIYEPSGAAGHRVPIERTTIRYFAYRCFNEGCGKAALAALNGMGKSISSERRYTRRVLLTAFGRGMGKTSEDLLQRPAERRHTCRIHHGYNWLRCRTCRTVYSMSAIRLRR